MQKITSYKKWLCILLALGLIAAVLGLIVSLKKDAPRMLRALGYVVEVKDATFRGFTSEKISASKDSEQIMLQIVKNVGKNASGNVLKELTSAIESVQQKVVITDPYSGRQQELSLPDSLKPVKEHALIRGNEITYYIVYTNEIFSLKIFSESEAKYKGLFSTYYCPDKKTAYALEIYADIKQFDKEKNIELLSSLFCK